MVKSGLYELGSLKPSYEYKLYKKEALAAGIPPQVYEAAMQFAVDSSDFIRDLRQYNLDRFENIIQEQRRKEGERSGLHLALEELKNDERFYRQALREYASAIESGCVPLRSFGPISTSYSARKENWRRRVDLAQQKVVRIEQEVENSSDVRNWEEKRHKFELLHFEYKDSEKIVEDEELRVKS